MLPATPQLVGARTRKGGIEYIRGAIGLTIGNVLLPIDCLCGCVILNMEYVLIFVVIRDRHIVLDVPADHVDLA
jgi:hypothetical protein